MGDESDEVKMIKVKWELSIGLVGCKRGGEIEIENDSTYDEIEDAVRDEVMQHLEWSWEREP